MAHILPGLSQTSLLWLLSKRDSLPSQRVWVLTPAWRPWYLIRDRIKPISSILLSLNWDPDLETVLRLGQTAGRVAPLHLLSSIGSFIDIVCFSHVSVCFHRSGIDMDLAWSEGVNYGVSCLIIVVAVSLTSLPCIFSVFCAMSMMMPIYFRLFRAFETKVSSATSDVCYDKGCYTYRQ